MGGSSSHASAAPEAGRAGSHHPVVLAAIADSPAAPGIARWAAELAGPQGGEVVVFTAVPTRSGLRTPAGRHRKGEEGSREEGAHVGRVRPALDGVGVPYRVLVRGCPVRASSRGRARSVARAVLRAARDVGADLVVLGQGSAGQKVSSSVAAHLLRLAGVDVLVVPEGTGHVAGLGRRPGEAGGGEGT